MPYTVEIYCDDECHPEYPDGWLVDEWVRLEPGRWMPKPDGDKWRAPGHLAYVDRTTGQVAGETFTPPFEPSETHVFVCRKCRRRGKRFPVEGQEGRLNEIFEKLYEHGVARISMTGLAARLRNSGVR